MVNDVILNKIASIERCIKRINEVYASNPSNLDDYTKQDSIILNIQRACECSIDLAMHIVSEKKLGIPQNSNMKVVQTIIEKHLIDFEEYTSAIKKMIF